MDLAKYAALFQSESREQLSTMNEELLALERAPTASEPVSAVFRAVHTMKGMSATMGYATVTALAHELESLLDRVRHAEIVVDRSEETGGQLWMRRAGVEERRVGKECRSRWSPYH